jgi:hypothetical protein
LDFLGLHTTTCAGSSGPDSCSHPSEGRIELATQSGDRLLSVDPPPAPCEKEFDLRAQQQQQSVEDLDQELHSQIWRRVRCADSKLLI